MVVSRLEKSLIKKRKMNIAEAYQYAGEVMKGANLRIEEAVEKVVSEGREDKEVIREVRWDIQEAKKEISDQQKRTGKSSAGKKATATVGDLVTIGESRTAGEVIEISGKHATVLTNGKIGRAHV